MAFHATVDRSSDANGNGKRRRAAFCGVSLIMAGLEAAFRDWDGLETVWVDVHVPDLKERLDAVCPDVIVLDLNDLCSEYALLILREYPGTPVIGVDLKTNSATVISSRKYETSTASDLAEVLQRGVRSQSDEPFKQ